MELVKCGIKKNIERILYKHPKISHKERHPKKDGEILKTARPEALGAKIKCRRCNRDLADVWVYVWVRYQVLDTTSMDMSMESKSSHLKLRLFCHSRRDSEEVCVYRSRFHETLLPGCYYPFVLVWVGWYYTVLSTSN